ncbi:MAG: flagellar hook protein FlgE [Pseudomonadota bacterium]
MSFYTSLSGLQAAQTELSVISHNLANVATNGFKKSRTEFADVIASSLDRSPTQMVGSGTVVKANRQQFGQGNLVQSQSGLDLAISGEGFFAVKPDLDSAKINFSRNGGFLVDAERYVVDGQGSHLQVFPVDGSGAVVATGLSSTQSLRLPETSGTPIATGNVGMRINLYANASIPATTPFDRFDPATYNQSTQTTVYDSLGNPSTLTNYFVRSEIPTGGNPNSEWEVHSFVGETKLTNSGAETFQMTFDANGAMTAPTAAVAFDVFQPAGNAAEQTISFSVDSRSTQSTTPFLISERVQDGAAVGQIEGVTIGEDGSVKASFSNGDTQVLGKVALAKFSNPSGMRQLGNSYWAATGLSGEASVGEAATSGFGNLMTGAIERSNVDITEELVGLISAQRNFQANAKALDTASQISQTIFNIQS